jgi:hypothetical protein
MLGGSLHGWELLSFEIMNCSLSCFPGRMLVIYKRGDESDGDGHNDLLRTTFCRSVFVSLDGTRLF